jgi:hypothetical protein
MSATITIRSNMKYRQGFVSNSSSSSYLIYGARITIEEKDELDKIHADKFPEPNEWGGPLADAADDIDLIYKSDEDERYDIVIGHCLRSSYNSDVNEVPELTKEQKEQTEKKLKQLGITKEVRLYLCGER